MNKLPKYQLTPWGRRLLCDRELRRLRALPSSHVHALVVISKHSDGCTAAELFKYNVSPAVLDILEFNKAVVFRRD